MEGKVWRPVFLEQAQDDRAHDAADGQSHTVHHRVVHHREDEDAAGMIARLSDGGMRDALSLLDQCVAYENDITLEDVYKRQL